MSSPALAPSANDGPCGLELRRPIGAGWRRADSKQAAVDLVDPLDRGRAVAEVDLLRIGRLVDGEGPLASVAVDAKAVAFENELSAPRRPGSLELGAVARRPELLPVGPDGQAVAREHEPDRPPALRHRALDLRGCDRLAAGRRETELGPRQCSCRALAGTELDHLVLEGWCRRPGEQLLSPVDAEPRVGAADRRLASILERELKDFGGAHRAQPDRPGPVNGRSGGDRDDERSHACALLRGRPVIAPRI